MKRLTWTGWFGATATKKFRSPPAGVAAPQAPSRNKKLDGPLGVPHGSVATRSKPLAAVFHP